MAIRIAGILFLTISIHLSTAIPPLRSQADPLGFFDTTADDASELERLPSLKSRLPTTVRPTNYKLEIQPILDDDPAIGTRFTAPGKMTISIECVTDTSLITFHSNTLAINFESIKVTEVGTNTPIPVTPPHTEVNETYAIQLGAPFLKAGRQYELYIEFVALVATNRYDGLYRSSYKNDAGVVRYLAATDFEADDARRAWPCFDEPNLKATWEISILRKDTYHSLSNTALETTVTLTDGWVKDVFLKTEPLPTYLVAIAVSDYTNKTADPTLFPGKPVNMWGPKPMMDRGAGDFAADFSARALQFFENHLETPSKLVKMDKISLGNDFAAGAMENWGLNTYRESRILFLDGVSTIDDKVRMTTTLSHEIAHQWFGNLVTMKWWSDIWLNEGFATYYAALGVNHVYPTYLAKESMTYNSVQYAMQADVLDTTRPLSAPVETGPQMDAMFDTLTYYKGASIIRMLNSALPEGTLHKGFVKYLAKFTLGNAEQDELFAVLDEQAAEDGALAEGLTVKSIMDTWTLQSGYPVVQVTESVDELEIRQEKFVTRFPNPDPTAVKWSIPITYYQAEETPNLTTRHWLNETTPYRTTITPARWVLVNPTQVGYYRVWYSPGLYILLLAQLRDGENFKVIDAQSRSALIDDSLNLGASGHYELTDALEVTKYMNKEQDLIPWVTLLTNMALPYRMFSRTASLVHFRRYMLELIKTPLTAIKMVAEPDETVDITMLRTRLMEWACNLGDSDCVSFAKAEFRKWMDAPNTNPIAPDLRPTIYCTAMANGGDEEWSFIVSQYKVADVGSPSIYLPEVARTTLIKALGCAKQTYRLAKLLDLALDYQSQLLPAHRLLAVQAVAGNSAGVELTFNFLKNNYATLLRRYGVGLISGTLTTLGNYMNTIYDFEDIEAFITAHSELTGVKTSETILNNYHWMSRVYSKMEPWMRTATAWP